MPGHPSYANQPTQSPPAKPLSGLCVPEGRVPLPSQRYWPVGTTHSYGPKLKKAFTPARLQPAQRLTLPCACPWKLQQRLLLVPPPAPSKPWGFPVALCRGLPASCFWGLETTVCLHDSHFCVSYQLNKNKSQVYVKAHPFLPQFFKAPSYFRQF